MNETKRIAAEVIYAHELKMEDALTRRGFVHPRTVATIHNELVEAGIDRETASKILAEYMYDLRCAVSA